MFYVYILKSLKTGKYYIGQTQNLKSRLVYHNSGKVSSTKPYIPYKLLWYKEFERRSEAISREKKLKNLKSRKRILGFMEKNGVNPVKYSTPCTPSRWTFSDNKIKKI